MTAPTMTCPDFCNGDHTLVEGAPVVHSTGPRTLTGADGAFTADMEQAEGDPVPRVHVRAVALTEAGVEELIEVLAQFCRQYRRAVAQ